MSLSLRIYLQTSTLDTWCTCTTNRRLAYLTASPHRSYKVVPEC